MIAAFDVQYHDDGTARGAAVVFAEFGDAEPTATHMLDFESVEPYVPGEFYRRELPCILALLETIESPIATFVVDGYVDLGDRPGLGAHLWDAIGKQGRVVGVAKTFFAGSHGVEVLRGTSERPLYVTATDDQDLAATQIRSMHGEHRMPSLLRLVDQLARQQT